MANFITKAKRTIRKITALTTGAALVTTSLAGAAFAADLSDYPSPFVQNGVWKGIIVVGSGATGSGAAADVIGATDIATTLTEVITRGTTTTSTVSVVGGESTRISSGGDNLNFGEYFGEVVSGALDDADLPMVLADGEYKDNEGNNDNEETYTQELTWPSSTGPRLVFATDDDGDEVVGDYIFINDGELFYNYTVEFDTDIDYDNTSTTTSAEDIEDTTLNIMGKPFIISDVTVASDRTISEIELLTGDTIVVLTKGQEFMFDGHTITITAVTDPDASSTECGVDVDGTTKFITEDDDEEFGEVRVGVADVFAIHGATEEDACELTLGSNILKLDSGSEVEIGGIDIGDREGDPDVTTANTINSASGGTWSGFEVSVEADDDVYLGSATDGDSWEDPVFGAFKISYAGLAGATERVTFKSSSDSGSFTFNNNDGKEVEIDFFTTDESNVFFGDDEDSVLLFESATAHGNGALDLSYAGNRTTADFAQINGNYWKSQNAFWINDSTKDIEDFKNTKLFVVTSGQTARVVEITKVDTDDGDVDFKDLTYGVSYDNRGTVNSTENGADRTFKLGSVGTITLDFWNDASGSAVGPIVRAVNVNLANSGDLNLGTGATTDTTAAETDGESLIELSENDEAGNVTVIIKENSDVTDVNRSVIGVDAYYDTSDEEILFKLPALESGSLPALSPGSSGSFLDADDNNDNDRYAMTIAGSLWHVKEDDDGNRKTVNADLVVGEARYAEAYISEVSAVVTGATDTITEEEVVTSTVTSLPVVKLDTEVGAAKTAQPLILVGGPAVNSLSAEALGLEYPTYGSQLPASLGLTEGVGIIKMVENAFGGSNAALIVAGWTAQNTRDAANVLKDYTSYRSDLVGSSVQVTSSAGVVTVGPVVVAPEPTAEETTEETAEE